VAYRTTTGSDGVGIGGALTMRSEESRGLVLYIAVDDIDAALTAIERAGGRRLTHSMPIPTVGWTALPEDTEGTGSGSSTPIRV
jgi:predicted enzyme related to lactoylglutathione lyase